jgi:hypothetical protein
LQSVILPEMLIGGEKFGCPGAFTCVMHNLANDSIGLHWFRLPPIGRSGITGTKKQSSGSFGGSVKGALVGPNALMISCRTGVSCPLLMLIQLPIPTGGMAPQLADTISLIVFTFAEPRVKLVNAELSLVLGV